MAEQQAPQGADHLVLKARCLQYRSARFIRVYEFGDATSVFVFVRRLQERGLHVKVPEALIHTVLVAKRTPKNPLKLLRPPNPEE